MGRPAAQTLSLKRYLALNAAALFGALALTVLLAGVNRLSGLRLLLAASVALLALTFSGVAVLLQARPAWERHVAGSIRNWVPRLALPLAILFLLFWCLTWLPPQYTGEMYYYFIGLYPLILCGLLASGSALILLIFPGGSQALTWCRRYFRERRLLLRAALAALLTFTLLALFTAQFGILQGAEPYWFGAGVPILAAQVLAAILVGFLALRLENWNAVGRFSSDAILFVLIWAVAAVVWASRPVPPSFWFTAPRPPNLEMYPFSDPVTYDVGSQFALIGQGIYNHMFFDRALYMSFLVYLHMLAGQDYLQLMSVQAVIFAVFPAVLYLIGKQLHSRTAGLVLAVLATLRGITGVDASAWIDTATFKHMLTDFPTAIGISIFVLLMLRWLESPTERMHYLPWASGVLGFTSLLRPHVLLLMGAAALLVLWCLRRQWKQAAIATGLAALAFLVGVAPWLVFGPSGGSLLAQYGLRLEAVMTQRYPRPVQPSNPAAPTQLDSPVPDAPPATPAPSEPAPASPKISSARRDPGVPFVVDHFVHNLVTSALIFPHSAQLLSVREIVKFGEQFWRPRWAGGMSTMAAVMLVLSLCVLAFGIGAATQRHRLRGLLPMAVLLIYFAANSAARTSGGRYLVPVDWILVAYFSIAVAELLHATRSFVRAGRTTTPALEIQGTEPLRGRRWRRAEAAAGWRRLPTHPATILGLLLLLGGLVPMAGILHPRRYADEEPARLVEVLEAGGEAAFSAADVKAFLQTPQATILQGRLLYPRFYGEGHGEPVSYAPYAVRGYPRTVALLIGPAGMLYVILPVAQPHSIPHASDGIVLGCRYQDGIYPMVSAVAVTLDPSGEPGTLWRNPPAALQCPLGEPVCADNGACY